MPPPPHGIPTTEPAFIVTKYYPATSRNIGNKSQKATTERATNNECEKRQESIPVGCIPTGAVAMARWGGGEVYPWWEGVSAQTPLPGRHPLYTTPIPHTLYTIRPCEQTDACENITFPILRMLSVNIHLLYTIITIT